MIIIKIFLGWDFPTPVSFLKLEKHNAANHKAETYELGPAEGHFFAAHYAKIIYKGGDEKLGDQNDRNAHGG